MTIMFQKSVATNLKCEQLRSISVTKQTGEPVALPIQVSCLGEVVGYEPIIDNVTGEEKLLLVCAEHAGDLNES